jgi:predicted nucleic acid-binding protein
MELRTVTKIIADSSVLILLAKCGLLQTLCDTYKVLAPSSVVEEVASNELQKKYPDAAAIADLVTDRKIKVQSPVSQNFTFPVSLDRGEKDALLLALETKKSLLATDDHKAIKTAKFLNLPFIVSPRIIIDLFKLSKISLGQARKAVEKLRVIGRYSPDIIAHAFLSLTEDNK